MRSLTNADIALVNGGSIRGDRKYSKNTPITTRTIASEFPFRAKLSVISIEGQKILDAIEIGLAGLDELEGSFPHISGMSITYNSNNEAGKRIVAAKINGNDIILNKLYSLATTDYLFKGGDGYKMLGSGTQIKDSIFIDSILVSDLLKRNIRVQGKLSNKIDDRMLDVSANNK